MRPTSQAQKLAVLIQFSFFPGVLLAQAWEPYSGLENLRRLMSGTVMEGAPVEGVITSPPSLSRWTMEQCNDQ